MKEISYTNLRKNMASVFDRVAKGKKFVAVSRNGERAIALVPVDELAGLTETAHLLQSPRNAERLLKALSRANEGIDRRRNSSSGLR